MAAADHTPWPVFFDWELDSPTSNGLKQEKQLSASQRRYYGFCRRKVRDDRTLDNDFTLLTAHRRCLNFIYLLILLPVFYQDTRLACLSVNVQINEQEKY